MAKEFIFQNVRMFSKLCVCSEGIEEPVKLISSQDGVFSYEYYPNSPGKFTVSITWGGQHIPKR